MFVNENVSDSVASGLNGTCSCSSRISIALALPKMVDSTTRGEIQRVGFIRASALGRRCRKIGQVGREPPRLGKLHLRLGAGTRALQGERKLIARTGIFRSQPDCLTETLDRAADVSGLELLDPDRHRKGRRLL